MTLWPRTDSGSRHLRSAAVLTWVAVTDEERKGGIAGRHTPLRVASVGLVALLALSACSTSAAPGASPGPSGPPPSGAPPAPIGGPRGVAPAGTPPPTPQRSSGVQTLPAQPTTQDTITAQIVAGPAGGQLTCALVIEGIPGTGEPSPVSLDRNGDGRCGWAADLRRNPDLHGRLLTFLVRQADGSEFGRASVRVGTPVATITAPPPARGTPPPPPANAAMTVDKTTVGYDEVFTFKANVPVGTRFTFVGVRSPDGALIPGAKSVQDTTESPHVFHVLYSNLYKYSSPRNGAHTWIFEFGGTRYEFAVTLVGAPTAAPGPQPSTPPDLATSTPTSSAATTPPASTCAPTGGDPARTGLSGIVGHGGPYVTVPLGGISLEAREGGEQGRLLGVATSGADGRFRIVGLPAGSQIAIAVPNGAFRMSVSIPMPRLCADQVVELASHVVVQRLVSGINYPHGSTVPARATIQWDPSPDISSYCVELSVENVSVSETAAQLGATGTCPGFNPGWPLGAATSFTLPSRASGMTVRLVLRGYHPKVSLPVAYLRGGVSYEGMHVFTVR